MDNCLRPNQLLLKVMAFGLAVGISVGMATPCIAASSQGIAATIQDTAATTQFPATWALFTGLAIAVFLAVIVATLVSGQRGLAWLSLYAFSSPFIFPEMVANHLPASPLDEQQLSIIAAAASLASLLAFAGLLQSLFNFFPARPRYLVAALAAIVISTATATITSTDGGTNYPGITAIVVSSLLAIFLSIRYYSREQSGYLRCTAGLLKAGIAAFLLYAWSVTQAGYAQADMLYQGLFLLCIVETAALCLLLIHLHKRAWEENLSNNEAAIRQEQKIATIAPLLNRNRHDLRAPVTDIIGLSELVLSAPLDQNQRVNVLEIQRLARNALIRINQLFLQQETSGRDGKNIGFVLTERFTLSELLLECTQYFSSLPCEITLEISPELPSHWQGDHIKLRQILLHGLEFMLPLAGDKPVHLQVSQRDQALVSFEISVPGATDGPTAEWQTADEHINIASALAQRLNGGLSVIHEQTCTRLAVNLPLAPIETPASVEDNRDLLRGKRLLVVDDNPISCNVLAEYARRWQMSVFKATGYQDALAILRHQSTIGEPVQFGLIDYVMDEIDGMALARTIKKEQGEHQKITLFLMSNATESIDPIQAKNSGITRILEKPLLPNTLNIALAEEAGNALALQEAIRKLDSDHYQSSNRDFSSLKILLVEDNPVSAKIVSAMLKRLAIDPDLAVDSQSALEHCRTIQYDIIFLDCELPDESGFETAKKIRAMNVDSGPGVYIVALTAYNDQQTRDQCIAAGMNKHLGKPIDMFQLESIIRLFLSRQGSPSDNSRNPELP